MRRNGADKSNPTTQTRLLELYSPHKAQLEMHESMARFRVGAFGRQCGKSTWALQELLKRGWTTPGVYWFISPTFEQAKGQYRRMVRALFACPDSMVKKNQTELRVKLVNGAVIRFVSGEVFDNLRGETLNGVVIDEVRDQPTELWSMVIRPMLATTNGWAAFISTPNGFDAFYDMAVRARSDKDWSFHTAPSTANPLFTQEEFDRLKKEMSEAQFAQEILAQFRDITSGKAYINFTQDNVTMTNPCAGVGEYISPWLPIIVGMDFNLSPMCWTLGQQRADKWYWFDEITLKDSHTPEAARELIERVRGHKPGIILAGDATSKAGQRAAAGQSDYDILCQMLDAAGIKFVNKTPDSNPHVKDRVNTVNSKFKSADGVIHMWVSPKCANLRRDCERVIWKQGSQAILDQQKDPTLTHQSDGVGYAVCALDPISFSNSKPRIVFVR